MRWRWLKLDWMLLLLLLLLLGAMKRGSWSIIAFIQFNDSQIISLLPYRKRVSSLDWLCHGIIIITIVHDYMKKMNCFFIYFSASLFVVFFFFFGNTSCHSLSWEKNIQIDALIDRFKTSLVHILNKLKRKECRFQIKFF